MTLNRRVDRASARSAETHLPLYRIILASLSVAGGRRINDHRLSGFLKILMFTKLRDDNYMDLDAIGTK